ncbi:MAG: hypothetical protein [Malazfec virus 2]
MERKRNGMNMKYLKVNASVAGETIEEKMRRIVNNREPVDIKTSSQLLFTERKDGVLPDTDIRADKWEAAVEATDKLSRLRIASRNKDTGIEKERGKNEDGGKSGGTESVEGTN